MRLASKRRSCAYDECRRRVAVSRGHIENLVAKVLVAITKRDVDVDRALPLTVHGHRLLPAHALVKGIGILDAGAPAEFDGTWKGNEQSQQTGARSPMDAIGQRALTFVTTFVREASLGVEAALDARRTSPEKWSNTRLPYEIKKVNPR